jgi:hypothetical protein
MVTAKPSTFARITCWILVRSWIGNMRIKEAIDTVQRFLQQQKDHESDRIEVAKAVLIIKELQDWQDWITEPDTEDRVDASGEVASWSHPQGYMGVRVEPDNIRVWVRPNLTAIETWYDQNYDDVVFDFKPKEKP